jgi:aldehyde:ferredoxin oxidoreductase
MADLAGYAGKLLDVNLTAQTSRTVPLDPALARDFIGGRALGVKMLMDEFGSRWDELDPLAPEAPFIITVGPLNGYCAGKTNSTIKSPLSGSAMAQQISGDMNAAIRFAGYDGIIIRGKADAPVYLYIHDDRVEFRDARSLWGMTTRETHRLLLADTDPMTQFFYIGPAGEKKVKYAVVMANWYKALARGGSGAVWGSKNLKALALKGTHPAPAVDDMKAMSRLLSHIHKVSPSRGANMHEYGTAAEIYSTGFDASSEPVRNWQEEWHDEKAIQGEFFAAEQWQRRYWADYACTLACCKIGRIKQGKHTGEITELPDYEGGAFVGPNFSIYNIQDIPHLCDVFDMWGIDVISGGSVLGWAAELYQRGILTKADFGGVELNWGDAEAFEQVIDMVAKREGIGNTLAEGCLKASKIIGQDTHLYAVQTKGIELGAHGVRSGMDYTRDFLSYALSTQGGDHTSIAQLDTERDILADSLVMCSFWRASPDEQLQLLKASTGFDISQEEMQKVYLHRWTTLQRITQLLAGWTYEDDTNPPRFFEPLPTGPYKGLKVDKVEEQQRVQEAYRVRGYDKRGIPTSESLEKLGLQDVDEILNPLRST